MDSNFWNGFFTVIFTLIIALMQYWLKVIAERTAKVAEKSAVIAEESAVDSKKLLNTVIEVGEKTYHLANSGRSSLLKIIADLSRWKAQQTKDVAYLAEADAAEKAYLEHEANIQKAKESVR